MKNDVRLLGLCGVLILTGCGGVATPPKGSLDCDSGRCRDSATGPDVWLVPGPEGGADRKPLGKPDAAAPSDAAAGRDVATGDGATSSADLGSDEVPPATTDGSEPETGIAPDAAAADAAPSVDLAPAPDLTPAPDLMPALDAAGNTGPDLSPALDVADEAGLAADAPAGVDAPPVLDAAAEAGSDATEDVPADLPVTVDAASDLSGDAPLACTGVLCDGFEDGDATGWTPAGAVTTGWAVAVDGAGHVYQQAGDTNASLRFSYAGQATWTDQTVQARVKVLDFGAAAATNRALVCARWQAADQAYCAFLSADAGGSLTILKRRTQGNGNLVLGTPVTGLGVVANTWYTVRIAVSGTGPVTIHAYLDPPATGTATPTVSATDDGQFITAGYAAVGTLGVTASFDDVVVSTP